MSVKPKVIEIYSKFNQTTHAFDMEILPQMKAFCGGYQLTAVKITVEEIVSWDIAKMRSFLHAVIIPAFTNKYKNACRLPDGQEITQYLIKIFLKARFLGYIKDDVYKRWEKPLDMEGAVKDLFAFCKLRSVLSSIKDPPKLVSSESLTPEQYWDFLNDLERFYHDEFNDMYDKREKPEKPLDSDVQ